MNLKIPRKGCLSEFGINLTWKQIREYEFELKFVLQIGYDIIYTFGYNVSLRDYSG